MNSGSMNEAMNSTEISGTPRISSTYSTHKVRIAGNRLCRPARPPRPAESHRQADRGQHQRQRQAAPAVGLHRRQARPPRISSEEAAQRHQPGMASQANARTAHAAGHQQRHQQRQASSGRHCSSYG